MMAVTRLLIVLLSVVVACNCFEPAFYGCKSSDQCNKGECCFIGRQRFSIPSCKSLEAVGDFCYPGADGEPFNSTLEYPNGSKLNVTNIYLMFCPCEFGLVCNARTYRCEVNSSLEDNLQ
uniref:Prokineticin domain-containing protein n=1 Tax=Cuerna arida TaxID=1464854 RepID=A0A1B6GF38_9HEMI